ARARLRAAPHHRGCGARAHPGLPRRQDPEQHAGRPLLQCPPAQEAAGGMSSKPAAVVTGGAGFIGSHMVDALLAAGFAVRVVDNLVGGHRSNLQHLEGNRDLACYWQDIRALEPDSPIFAGARYVFHFAGIGDIVPSIERPTEYLDTNVQGTVRVLECARHARVRKLVYAASSSCYGLAATPTREDHPISPQYPYALSKYQ